MIRPNAYEATGEKISRGIALSAGVHPDFEHAVVLGTVPSEQIWVPVSPDESPVIRGGILVTGHLVVIDPINEACADKMIVGTENADEDAVLIKVNAYHHGVAGRGLHVIPAVNKGSSKFDVRHTTRVLSETEGHLVFSHHTVLHELAPGDVIAGELNKQHALPKYTGNLPVVPAIANKGGEPDLMSAERFHKLVKIASKHRAEEARANRRKKKV